MRFGSGQCASVIGVAPILLFCSGEEHHVGKMPEVQKEDVDPAHHRPDVRQHEPNGAETPPPAESR